MALDRMYLYVKTIDTDVKYILLFIACKIFYIVDIRFVVVCWFVHYMYLITNLNTRYLYDKC